MTSKQYCFPCLKGTTAIQLLLDILLEDQEKGPQLEIHFGKQNIQGDII